MMMRTTTTMLMMMMMIVVFAYLRNEFHFSDVYRSINYIGSRAK